jgi:glutathione S-transferase
VLSSKGEIRTDESVERWRRAHLNDLENIPALIAASFFYLYSKPENEVFAVWLMRIAAISRIVHTIVREMIKFWEQEKFSMEL